VGPKRHMDRPAGWPSGRKGLLLPPLELEVEEEIPLLFSFQFRWGLTYWVQFEFEKVLPRDQLGFGDPTVSWITSLYIREPRGSQDRSPRSPEVPTACTTCTTAAPPCHFVIGLNRHRCVPLSVIPIGTLGFPTIYVKTV
jgi:hypothetical protein